jgi:hypothetical protein
MMKIPLSIIHKPHGAETFLRSQQLLVHSKNSKRFIKPEVHHRVHSSPPLSLSFQSMGISEINPQLDLNVK